VSLESGSGLFGRREDIDEVLEVGFEESGEVLHRLDREEGADEVGEEGK
jgi:hypothetical protein